MPWGKGLGYLHAGVHMLVLCARTGRLLRTANFMTWQMASSSMLVKELKELGRGRILILAGVVSECDFSKHIN